MRRHHVFVDVSGRLYRALPEIATRNRENFPTAVIVAVSPDDLAKSFRAAGEVELTSRECEIALLLAARASNAEIAAQLGISCHTARHHTQRVLEKFAVSSRTEMRKRVLSGLSRSESRHLK